VRRLAVFVLCAMVGACASSRVALLRAEAGGATGAVAVLDPANEAERGQLTEADTQASLARGAVRPRPLTANYDALLAVMPPPPRVFTLYFMEGTTQLAPQSAATFDELRRLVTAASDVQITGHTDTTGDAASNDRLSLDRAIQVRAALAEEGLPVANARVAGRGEREPRVATGDGVSEPNNRRVEVIVR
jgi:outer membrane protein OmpA-like peptidoglycan-associated protein